MTKFSTKIYEAWRNKQIQKYEDLYPRIKKYLKSSFSVIDIGIGPAWLEEFLLKKGIKFKRIVGIDPDSTIIKPKKDYIEYHITEHFETDERFDFLVCFDVLHLIKRPEKLLELLKPNSMALFSVPLRFKEKLDFFHEYEALEGGEVGKEEKDYFMLIKL